MDAPPENPYRAPVAEAEIVPNERPWVRILDWVALVVCLCLVLRTFLFDLALWLDELADLGLFVPKRVCDALWDSRPLFVPTAALAFVLTRWTFYSRHRRPAFVDHAHLVVAFLAAATVALSLISRD